MASEKNKSYLKNQRLAEDSKKKKYIISDLKSGSN